MKNYIWIIIISVFSVACGDGSRLGVDRQDFFSQENPFLPVIRLLGDNPLVIEKGQSFQDPGAQAQSLQEGDISANIQVSGEVNTNQVGQYSLTYRVSDSEQRTVSINRLVIVVDTSAPEVVVGSLGSSPSNSAAERLVRMSGEGVTHYRALHLNSNTCSGADLSSVPEKPIAEDFSFTPAQGNNIVCAVGRDETGNYQTQISSSGILFVDSLAPIVEIDNSDLLLGDVYSTQPRIVRIFDQELDATHYRAVSLRASSCSAADFSGAELRPIGQTFTFNVSVGLNILCAIGVDALGNIQGTPTASAVLQIQNASISIDLHRPSPTRDDSPIQASISGSGVNFYKAVHRTSNTCDAVSFSGVPERAVSEAFSFTPSQGNNIVCAVGRNTTGTYSNDPSDIGSAFIFVDSVLPVLQINSAGLGASPSNQLGLRTLSLSSAQSDVTHYRAKLFEARENCNGVDLSLAPEYEISEAFNFTPQAADSSVGNRNYIVCAKARDSIGYDGPTAASSVLVIDTVAPVIELNGNAHLDLSLCTNYEEQGGVVRDLRNSAYQNLGAAQVSGSVNSLIPSTYSMEYSGQDAAGNSAEVVVREVVVSGSIDGTDYHRGIASRSDLEAISEQLDWNYYLCADLNLEGASFSAIASSDDAFSGVFEGNSYEISNLNLQEDESYRALFAKTSNTAKIRNLVLSHVNIEARGIVGAVVGSHRGEIQNVHVSSGRVKMIESQSADRRNYGGLVGENFGSIIFSSASLQEVHGIDSVGGLVGENKPGGSILKSYAQGLVSSTDGTDLGGLVGKNSADENASGLIAESFSSVNIQASTSSLSLGGLVGENQGLIRNSYAEGSVTGGDIIGGLVGEMLHAQAHVENSYALGVGGLQGGREAEAIGGLIGKNEIPSSVISSYWDIETSGIGDLLLPPSAEEFGTPLNTAQMQTEASFVGWDFTNIWNIQDALGYPYLIWEP